MPPKAPPRLTPADSATYTLTATGPGGTADASVRVTIADADCRAHRQPTATGQNFQGPASKTPTLIWIKPTFAPTRAPLSPTPPKFFRNYPELKATIEGHCDERGSTEYNLGLGDRRATAVKNYLVSLGISADRLSTVSYGKEKPFCMEATEACYQQNRRGHFVRAN